MNLAELKQPFNIDDIEVRAGASNKDDTQAMALAYLTSRAVMDRLDNVCGAENWRDGYQILDDGVICTLSLRVGDEWIGKTDGAAFTQFDGFKGGISDALKRAGVKWGIGRYLYSLPTVWVPVVKRGKSLIIVDPGRAKAQLLSQKAEDHPLKFETFDQLLYGLYQSKGWSEPTAKQKLKEAGYTTIPANGDKQKRFTEMYQAVTE